MKCGSHQANQFLVYHKDRRALYHGCRLSTFSLGFVGVHSSAKCFFLKGPIRYTRTLVILGFHIFALARDTSSPQMALPSLLSKTEATGAKTSSISTLRRPFPDKTANIQRTLATQKAAKTASLVCCSVRGHQGRGVPRN